MVEFCGNLIFDRTLASRFSVNQESFGHLLISSSSPICIDMTIKLLWLNRDISKVCKAATVFLFLSLCYKLIVSIIGDRLGRL